MRRDISPEQVVEALLRESTFAFKEKGNYLRGLCPQCGKPELLVRKSMPWQVMCSREVNCGYRESVRNLLPDLFSDFVRRYPPTEKEPFATADAYLGLDRGFDLSKIRGCYEQAAYHIPGTSEIVPTVRFYIDAQKTRWWERLIGKTKKDGQKANFGGKRTAEGFVYKGEGWMHPDQTIEAGDRVFLVEGVFHAIALYHAGIKAVAGFSSGNVPEKVIKACPEARWVVALDRDTMKKGKLRAYAGKVNALTEKPCLVCIPPDARDWDDLYRQEMLTPAFLDECLYRGRLYMSETADEVAYHKYVHDYITNRLQKYTVEFKNALYAVEVKEELHKTLVQEAGEDTKDRYDYLRSERGRDVFRLYGTVSQISNVLPKFLYLECDAIMDEQRYVFEINYSNGAPKETIRLEGSAITEPKTFHKALLSKTGGGTFYGSAGNLKYLIGHWLGNKILKISSVPYIGYVPELKAYVFQKHAYCGGKEIPINEHDYFEIGKQGIKTGLAGIEINTSGKFSPDWLTDYAKAFHWQGIAALAFFLGSLFVQQIRLEQKSFPFFELTGEPGAGKSTILEFLWKCLGRDEYEGFDLLKATQAGRRRAFSQVSNLPVVIIESDRDGEKDAKQRQFGFDEMKPFFNGRGTGTLGVATRSNATEEHLFQGALLIAQNAEVDGSEALLQRIVHCHADKKHHTPGSREIARWFERQRAEDVGGFLTAALKAESAILDEYRKAFVEIEARYSASEALRNERVIKNHAQVAACGCALSVLFPVFDQKWRDGLEEYLLGRAIERERRLLADHPLLEQFWDQFDYLNDISTEKGKPDRLNHATDDAVIAVNLNHFMELSRSAGQPVFDTQALKKLFPNCKRHKFIENNKVIWSKHENRSFKCWVFKK